MIVKTNKLYIFIVFLAVLVFNAHMIMPHDHHQAESANCKTSIPFQKNSSDHHGFPLHCHAFNNIDSEKAVSYSLSNYIQKVQFTCNLLSKESESVLLLSGIAFSDDSKKTIGLITSDYFSLRAPPSRF